ncbi:MAG TPA: lipopolysaccharide heptosyltransferase I [Tepidisphaeraceae bacterium]|nr:lipopolysaccharide heptosyltransferase I [Tepidisphaeraceae bacterium]
MTISDFQSPPQRILLIKPSSLGDVVHALPVLNLLRRKWPQAQISWLVSNQFSDLLRGNPQLSEVIEFDRRKFARWWFDPRATVALFRFLRDLSKRRFDLVIDLQGLHRSGWLTWLTHAPLRVGFANARELAHLFYTHRVPIDSMEQHAIQRYLAITEALGCGREPVEFHLTSDAADEAHVESLVGAIGPYAILLPGANWLTKRWPAERFARLIEPLRSQFGLATVVAGGGELARLASQIPADVNVVGKTSLRQLVALIQRASLVIANDSGPMHIAAALNKPLVTIFGPTNPIRTGPFQRLDSVVRVDIPCSPCYSRKCSHTSCMKWLGIEPVLDEAARQMTNDQTRMTNQ